MTYRPFQHFLAFKEVTFSFSVKLIHFLHSIKQKNLRKIAKKANVSLPVHCNLVIIAIFFQQTSRFIVGK